jgi:lysophospholipase L1-like esterase
MSIVSKVIGGVVAAGVVGGLGSAAVWQGKRKLEAQAAVARMAIGKPHGAPPDADRTYKKGYGDRLDLLLLGDSIAAGLGADHPRDTLGARLAKGLAKKSGRSVRLRTAARVGAETSMLAEQLTSLPASYRPDVAVIIVGGNDVTHRIPVDQSVSQLAAAVVALQERGAAVVVGTCPDLGALRPVPQPLRALGSVVSRQLANAQRDAVVKLGAHAVELHKVVGHFFITNPEEMFSLDRFHPSSLGYRRTAKAMLPSLLVALGIKKRAPIGHHLPVGKISVG